MTAPRRLTAHPTVVALLIGGLVLAGGIALIVVLGRGGGPAGSADRAAGKQVGSSSAASSPAPSSSAPSSPARSSSSAPTSSAPASSAPASSSAPKSSTPTSTKPVTYVVKRGDNLTVIAAWFHEHGYGSLYERNRAVIGNDPDLIIPGQKITISSGGRMSVSG